ncbi:MAG TPA: hypothetical protein VJH92_02390 [Candidatus Nanoarchaeia archaeon]|nr:hypothetical protein [Candidatus Nanoarchaeia archaeon]
MPNKEYKSFEQLAWDELKEPLSEFASNFCKTLWGAYTLPFRIPTFVRKTATNSNLAQREHYFNRIDNTPSTSKASGEALGFMAGITALAVSTFGVISEAPDYRSLYVLAVTNALSGIYETTKGIVAQRRNSKLEQQTQIPAQ